MRRWVLAASALGAIGSASGAARAERLADSVNPLRGSRSTNSFSRGNTFPAVTLPFGFNFWTPITEPNSERWLYNYSATTIQGFGASHEPSPWIADHGTVQVMPMTGALHASATARAAAFTHANETARPYYYGVTFNNGIKTEIAPTDHASVWQFTFPTGAPAYVLVTTVNLATVFGKVTVDAANRTISGYTDHRGPRFYYSATFDSDITMATCPNEGGSSQTKACVQFSNPAGPVHMKMGTSFISAEQARDNLKQEVGDKSFDQIKEAAAATWDAALGRIEIESATAEQKTTFYSCLYRAFMYPNSMWENVGGSPKYFSPYIAGNEAPQSGKIYVNNGFWDTARAVWPFYALMIPSQAGTMLDGFVNAYRDGGWTPRWTGPGYIDIMVGTHSDIIFADSFMRGVTNFDTKSAYQSMLKNALVVSPEGSKGRKGNEVGIFKGYIPTEALRESAAWYLEDVVNDFGISQMAKAQGDETHERYFLNRSLTYTNLFSPSVGFFRGKKANGDWRAPDAAFKPNEWGWEFTEGDPWHYATAAPNDPQGMANLYGGRDALAAKIDGVFAAPKENLPGGYGGRIHEMDEAEAGDMGQYAHANQPIQHMIYMYNYAGAPAKTAKHVRDVLARPNMYNAGADGSGYLGDEDNGQMSAWYLFSALGFYPASLGHPEYAIGSPLFTKATIHLENGKSFVITARGNDATNIYVQSATLNGAPYDKNFLSHADVAAGGALELTMGSSPSAWGTGEAALPTSITRGTAVAVAKVDRAVGGTPSSSAAEAGEDAYGAENLFDDDSRTTWRSEEPAPFVQYRFAEGKAHAIGMYTLTSSDSLADRDPKDWKVKASHDGVSWTIIDRRENQNFAWRQQTRVFAAQNTTAYEFYRLEVSKNHGDPATELSELEWIDEIVPSYATAAAEADAGLGESAGEASSSGGCGCGVLRSDITHAGLASGAGALGLLVWRLRRKRRR